MLSRGKKEKREKEEKKERKGRKEEKKRRKGGPQPLSVDDLHPGHRVHCVVELTPCRRSGLDAPLGQLGSIIGLVTSDGQCHRSCQVRICFLPWACR